MDYFRENKNINISLATVRSFFLRIYFVYYSRHLVRPSEIGTSVGKLGQQMAPATLVFRVLTQTPLIPFIQVFYTK